MGDWSLAITAPARERAVCRRLDYRAFENYFFQVKRRVVRNGRVTMDLVPAFPSYVFVAARSAWDALRDDVIDLIGFVAFGGEVASVPPNIVTTLLKEADPDGVLPLEVVDELEFLPGQRVRIAAGPACGYFGTFVRMVSSDRALILVDKLPVSVSVSHIEKVERRRRRRRNSVVGDSAALAA